MNRQQTSQDYLASNHSADAAAVLHYLERDCPQLFDEVSMVMAVFEDARVNFLTKGAATSGELRITAAPPPRSKTAAEEEKTRQQKQKQKEVNDGGDDDDDDAGKSNDRKREKEDHQPAAAPLLLLNEVAIAVHVPLRTVQGDGATTLAQVLLTIVLEHPEMFPRVFSDEDDEGNGGGGVGTAGAASGGGGGGGGGGSGGNSNNISIRFKTMQLAPALRSDLAHSLLTYARELQATDALTIAGLAARAEEMLLDLPVAVQSTDFGCCLNCNKIRLQAKQIKVPQPIRINSGSNTITDSVTSPKTTTTTTTTGTTTTSAGQATCLMCRSNLVVHIPSMMPTKKTECSFCLCEDHPLITVPGCGCISCFDCFARFAAIAVGAKQLRRPTFGWRGMGIACPNHPRDAYLNDPGLIKLCDRRTNQRFNTFSVKELCVKNLGGFVCANPHCHESAVPQITSSMKNGLAKCLFCDRASCLQCGCEAVLCECDAMKAPTNMSMNELQESLYRSECVKCTTVPCSVESGQVMFVLGSSQAILDVPLHSTKWRQWPDAHLWTAEIPERKQRYASYVCVFHGTILRPDWTLAQGGCFPGSVVYLVPLIQVIPAELADELELWKFRRDIAKSSGSAEQKSNETMATVTKSCPFCKTKVAHFKYHGCHHIGAHGRCCTIDNNRGWCYACNGPWPCTKCPIFCNDTCDCPPCPTCAPAQPCEHCDGCARCKTKAEFS